MKNAAIIFKKEIKEVIKNKNIWMPILIITAVFSIGMPLAITIGSNAILKDGDTINFINKVFGHTDDPMRVLIGDRKSVV